MQINKINTTTFGATPDLETRKLLLNARLNGINTQKLEHLMKTCYADKYIMSGIDKHGRFKVNISNKNGSYAESIQNILMVNPEDLFFGNTKYIIGALTGKFETLKAGRSPKQRHIDEIENKFGRYEEAGDYERSNFYKTI